MNPHRGFHVIRNQTGKNESFPTEFHADLEPSPDLRRRSVLGLLRNLLRRPLKDHFRAANRLTFPHTHPPSPKQTGEHPTHFLETEARFSFVRHASGRFAKRPRVYASPGANQRVFRNHFWRRDRLFSARQRRDGQNLRQIRVAMCPESAPAPMGSSLVHGYSQSCAGFPSIRPFLAPMPPSSNLY